MLGFDVWTPHLGRLCRGETVKEGGFRMGGEHSVQAVERFGVHFPSLRPVRRLVRGRLGCGGRTERIHFPTVLPKQAAGIAWLFHQPKQKMSRPNVGVSKLVRLLGGQCQNSFAFVAERQIDGSRDLLLLLGGLYPLANRFEGKLRAEFSKAMIFAEQTQHQVLGVDDGASELAGLVAREKDGTSRFFGVSLKHAATPRPGRTKGRKAGPAPAPGRDRPGGRKPYCA